MPMFEGLIDKISQKLEGPLPGEAAHERMLATAINGSRLRMRHEKPPRLGGVMILLYEHDGDVYLPLMRRPDYDGVHSGQVSFPGGKHEKEDADLIETAIRETEEEIGVHRSQIEVIGTMSEFFISASNFQVLPVVGYVSGRPSFVPDPVEVAAVIEAPLSDLLNPGYQRVKEMDVRGYRLRTPYFDVMGNTVWGATAMMLSEFVEVLQGITVTNTHK